MYPTIPTPHTAETADLDKRMAQWRQFAVIGNPATNPDYIRTVCEEIVRRAQIIAQRHPVRFYDVAVFFLERTQAWLMTGLPVQEIGPKLPKNLTELGVLKMTEGSDVRFGGPMTDKELRPVAKTFQKIVQ